MLKQAHQHCWPKKCSASEFAQRWYTKPCAKTVINRIKAGKLPGGQEYETGPWFVWVINTNLDPAYGYGYALSANDSQDESTASAIANTILNGIRNK